jgi:hypothetical protein
VTPSATAFAATLWSDQVEPLRHQIGRISLMHGWVPGFGQVIAAVVLVCAIGRAGGKAVRP